MCLTGGDTSFDSLSEFNFFSDENLMDLPDKILL